MRNSNGTGYNCDAHVCKVQGNSATTHVSVWGGIWNGEVSDFCDKHTGMIRDRESVYDRVRYTSIDNPSASYTTARLDKI